MICVCQEEAATRVRARPLPSHTQDFIPQRSSKPLTETENFHLSSEARHERAEREFQEKIRREEEEARLASRVWLICFKYYVFIS